MREERQQVGYKYRERIRFVYIYAPHVVVPVASISGLALTHDNPHNTPNSIMNKECVSVFKNKNIVCIHFESPPAFVNTKGTFRIYVAGNKCPLSVCIHSGHRIGIRAYTLSPLLYRQSHILDIWSGHYFWF